METISSNDYYSCVHNKKRERQTFYIFKKDDDKKEIFNTGNTTIVFLLEGTLSLSYKGFMNRCLSAGQMLLLPPATAVELKTAGEDVYAVICSFEPRINFCQKFTFHTLLPLCKGMEESFYPLPIVDRLNTYLTLMRAYMEDNFYCPHFYEIKIDELFYVLRGYYDRSELASFFHWILNDDIFFKDNVLKLYQKIHSVGELASMMNYSTSGFKKKFRRTFGLPVYTWILEQRAAAVFRDLKEDRKSLTEISFDYGFSSNARLFDFCKKHFGKAPGEVRKEK
jgi:AraC-like DNA-binding protein